MGYCDNCGQPLAEGAKYCERCGAPVSGVSPAPGVVDAGRGGESAPASDAVTAAPVDGGRRKRRPVIVLAALLAVLLAAGVGFGGYRWVRANHADALADCTDAVKALSAAGRSADTVRARADAVKNADVADEGTLTTLSKTVGDLDGLPSAKYACPADASAKDLEATAEAANTAAKQRNDIVDKVSKAVAAVESSKAAKSFDAAKSTLADKISEAKALLDSSKGRVKDDGVRTALSKAIDTAESAAANANVNNAEQVVKAVETLSRAVDAVSKAVAEESAADSDRCAEWAGSYYLNQGDAQLELSAGCSITSSDGWSASYTAGSFSKGSDGTYSWSTSGSGNNAATLYPTGVLPPSLVSSYGADAAHHMADGHPNLLVGGSVYSRGE